MNTINTREDEIAYLDQTEEAEMRSAITLINLDNFITYLEDTDEDEWCTDVVRSKANESQNCIFGHLVNWYYGKGYEGEVSEVWFAFEEMWATTFMIYPVNDGEDAHYTQETPKQRVLAYLRDLNDGRAKTSSRLLEEENNW